MRRGTDYGRRGYGAIYVVASGNGGVKNDNCNYDGYANSVYTITIGAVDEFRHMPYYAEECASMLAVTYSSGGVRRRSIVSTVHYFLLKQNVVKKISIHILLLWHSTHPN